MCGADAGVTSAGVEAPIEQDGKSGCSEQFMHELMLEAVPHSEEPRGNWETVVGVEVGCRAGSVVSLSSAAIWAQALRGLLNEATTTLSACVSQSEHVATVSFHFSCRLSHTLAQSSEVALVQASRSRTACWVKS